MKVVFALVLAIMVSGCGASTPPAQESTLPAPLFTQKLPDPPEDAPADKRIVLPVSACNVEGSEDVVGPGIYMSQEMSMRVSRTKVAYDEIRALYEIDLRTMDRERGVYQKNLDLADQEIVRLREAARRTWWERHGDGVMVGVGLVLGAGFAVGMAAALDGVVNGGE